MERNTGAIDKNFGNSKEHASARTVNEFHSNSDVDSSPDAQHHTLGIGPNKAAPGDHVHNGEDAPRLLEGQSISGSLSNGDALKSLITILSAWGLQDETTA